MVPSLLWGVSIEDAILEKQIKELYGLVSVVFYLRIILRLQQQQLGSALYLLQALKQVISSVNVRLSNYQTSNLTALMVTPCFVSTGSLCSSLPSTIPSDSEKITYLQTLVSNSAKEAISVYECNPLFYKTAVDEFRRRFGHPKHVVNHLRTAEFFHTAFIKSSVIQKFQRFPPQACSNFRKSSLV